MQQPLIEATLFRIDQLKPFLKELNLYEYERLLLSFPRDFWIEMRKPKFAESDTYPGDKEYVVSGVMHKSENPFPYIYNLARLFDERNVRVQAYNSLEMELDPVEPLNTDDLWLKLVGYGDFKKRPAINVNMQNKVRILRIEQLLGLTDWVHSYRDQKLELCIESNMKACIELKKPEKCKEMYQGDCRYDVTGKSHSDIFQKVEGIFLKSPVTVEVSNVKSANSYMPISPMQLETFVIRCAKYNKLY